MFDPRGRLSPRHVAPVLVATALLGPTLPPPLQAQSLSYTTAHEVEFSGAMGGMMKMLPDAQVDQRQVVHIKGTRMRLDSGNLSTLMEVTDGRYTMLDHQSRTFYSLTAEDMQAQLEQAQEQLAAFGAPSVSAPGPAEEGAYELEISKDRTGQARLFNGYSAEQILITMEIVPVSPAAMETAAMTGRTVIFTELWISTDVPGAAEYREAQKTMGKAILESRGPEIAGVLSQALAGNPSMQEAIERNWAEMQDAEMQDMEGVPVLTVINVVSVPAGAAFDPGAVLDAADQPLEVGELPSTPEAALEMAREILGGLMGGVQGRRSREETEPVIPAGPVAQTITMRSTATLEEIRTDNLPDDLFRPPPDYTERRPPWMKGG